MKVDLKSQINFIHAGEATKRFHTVRTIKENTVAGHSFTVIWLLYLLTEGSASSRLIMAGAAHDLAEHIAGDMPSPSKRALDIGRDVDDLETSLLEEHGFDFPLSKKDRRLLKMADRMAGALFCVEERSMGNVNVAGPFNNFMDYARELQPVGVESEMLDIIALKWKEVSLCLA
jgi:5'-deoxynucleotidase YfbR-like HD superfamily hydrolase